MMPRVFAAISQIHRPAAGAIEDMIFLIRRGRQAIHAVRVRQRFILAEARRGGDWAIIKPELTPPFFYPKGTACGSFATLCFTSSHQRDGSSDVTRRFPLSPAPDYRHHGSRFTSMEVTAGDHLPASSRTQRIISGYRVGLSQQYLFRRRNWVQTAPITCGWQRRGIRV